MSVKVKDDLTFYVPYPLLNNQWLLTLNGFAGMEFMVRNVDLPNPFPNLNTEELPNGNHYYTKADYEKEWSFTIFEDVDVRAFTFFNDWLNSVYDPENMQFNLKDGEYTKNFTLTLKKPSEMDLATSATITSQRMLNNLVDIAETRINSAIGRLEKMASELISSNLTKSGAGVPILQKLATAPTSLVSGVAKEVVSYGFEKLLLDTNHHTEDSALIYNMTNTIIKSIDKISLEYGDGDPIEWKITLASDIIEVRKEEETILGGLLE